MKPYALDQREREQRQRAYLAAPTIAAQFPSVAEISVEMRFRDPDAKLRPSPFRRIFSSDMQAFFAFQCPLKDCTNGGFDLTAAVPHALARKNPVATGKLNCKGKRKRTGATDPCCNLELEYHVTVPGKQAVAA